MEDFAVLLSHGAYILEALVRLDPYRHEPDWENLMDAQTVLLTANTETVYAISHLDLKTDGPTVVDAPPHMLGFLQDGLQRYLADIGPLGPDKGSRRKIPRPATRLLRQRARRVFRRAVPYLFGGVRGAGFPNRGQDRPGGRLDEANQGLSAGQASSPPPMEFMNGSRRDIDTLFPDNFHSLNCWRCSLTRSLWTVLDHSNDFRCRRSASRKASRSTRMKKRRRSVEAARLGGAMARANTYASASPGVFYYPDRKWQHVPDGMTYTFTRDGAPQIDARNNVYYMAAGNSPAMMDKNVGKGSQYLWTYRDTDGNFLDGAKNYKLHILPNIPANNFWSVSPAAADGSILPFPPKQSTSVAGPTLQGSKLFVRPRTACRRTHPIS